MYYIKLLLYNTYKELLQINNLKHPAVVMKDGPITTFVCTTWTNSLQLTPPSPSM